MREPKLIQQRMTQFVLKKASVGSKLVKTGLAAVTYIVFHYGLLWLPVTTAGMNCADAAFHSTGAVALRPVELKIGRQKAFLPGNIPLPSTKFG